MSAISLKAGDAEAKLRCLTKLQQLLAEYGTVGNADERAPKRPKLLQDLTDIEPVSKLPSPSLGGERHPLRWHAP